MEADFAQLEFRTAAFLAQDKTAMEEIATGFDVHSYTAKVITDAGEPRHARKLRPTPLLLSSVLQGTAEARLWLHTTNTSQRSMRVWLSGTRS
jgi:hypothetical protein